MSVYQPYMSVGKLVELKELKKEKKKEAG